MNVLSFSDFENKKINFINHNGGLKNVITSNLEGTQYQKRYICENGEDLTEVNRKVLKRAKASIYGLEIFVDVELFESEQYNSKDGTSYYTYQNY
jgi:hypothetical protein